jgi:hypothetical protein
VVDTDGMQQRCLRWANDNATVLSTMQPELPAALNDRQADSWEPLLAVGLRAGLLWGDRARAAALALSQAGAADLDQAELGEELLRDIRGLFDDRANQRLNGGAIEDTDRLSSADMVSGLLALNDRPWAEANRGKAITQHWLARRLSTFSITVKNVRFADARVLKGYTCEQFDDAWSRYLGD